MLRICACLLAAAVAALGQPESARLPLEEWLNGSAETRIRWSLRLFPATLSEYQRLETYIWASVAVDEFVKKPGRGPLALLFEIRDRDNRTYRTRRILSVNQNPTDLAAVRVIQHVCILPGDYEVAAAVYDPESKEHNLKRATLRVPELAHDPLPGAWRDLPNVEFRSCGPANSSRLSIPLETEKPVQVEVVMNQTVNRSKSSGSVVAQMNTLIPRLEVLSEMELRNGSMNVTLLDVERRKVTFTGEVSGRPIRRRIGPALRENDPGKIDIHSLENYTEDAQFFISEIRKRLVGSEPQRVMIVLSAPLDFPKGEDLTPIQTSPQPGNQVFYIRCNSPLYPSAGLSPGPAFEPALPANPAPHMARYVNNSDSLERTLKPLHPRLFDVTTAAEFRSALAAIMNEISQQR